MDLVTGRLARTKKTTHFYQRDAWSLPKDPEKMRSLPKIKGVMTPFLKGQKETPGMLQPNMMVGGSP